MCYFKFPDNKVFKTCMKCGKVFLGSTLGRKRAHCYECRSIKHSERMRLFMKSRYVKKERKPKLSKSVGVVEKLVVDSVVKHKVLFEIGDCKLVVSSKSGDRCGDLSKYCSCSKSSRCLTEMSRLNVSSWRCV